MTHAEFYVLVVILCQRFHGTMTSGVRSWKRNSAVGGHPNSRHLLGLAIDVVLDEKGLNGQLFMSECERQGLVCLDEDDHFHVQTK